MYLDFYGLAEKPFNQTPDPRFLYFTEAHREALAQLEYGVNERRGFLVLTGEVGTGKTTLLRALFERLDGSTEAAFVFNSMLTFDEILEYVLEDFGIPSAGSTPVQRLVALNRFLTDRLSRGLNTALIIDEAQNLDAASLEQIRLLSNFETPTAKLLQILLVGQPELKSKLRLPDLRQLRQRIGLRCTIRALAANETADYIRHRLRVAAGPSLTKESELRVERIFAPRAVKRIHEYSRGIPRVVNVICDHCLLIGYADQKQRIDHRIAQEAIEYLEEGERTPRRRTLAARLVHSVPYPSGATSGVVALVLGLVALLVLARGDFTDLLRRVVESLWGLTLAANDLVGHLIARSRDVFS